MEFLDYLSIAFFIGALTFHSLGFVLHDGRFNYVGLTFNALQLLAIIMSRFIS